MKTVIVVGASVVPTALLDDGPLGGARPGRRACLRHAALRFDGGPVVPPAVTHHGRTAPGATRVAVPASRVAAWVDGFARRHGELRYQPVARDLRLTAADGSWAELTPYLCDHAIVPGDAGTVAAWAGPERLLALVLVRRGGYAVGLARGSGLIATNAGTRYVQSRTAAGGWSQQRYQRRRRNQGNQLIQAVTAHLTRLIREAGDPDLDGVITGGDRALLRTALPPDFAGLPRREIAIAGDPRSAALETAIDVGRGPSVLVSDVTRR